MPMIQVNLNEAERIEPVPEGDYLLKIVEVEYPVETSKGGEMMSITFDIEEPTKVGEMDTFGRKVWTNFSTRVVKEGVYDESATRKSWGYLADFVDELGVSANGKGELDSNDFLNATIWCRVKQREYEGRISNECGKFFQASAATTQAAPSR